MMQPAPANGGIEPVPSTGRILCGWCNRLIGIDASGVTRHVTCDDCRGVASCLAEQRD